MAHFPVKRWAFTTKRPCIYTQGEAWQTELIYESCTSQNSECTVLALTGGVWLKTLLQSKTVGYSYFPVVVAYSFHFLYVDQYEWWQNCTVLPHLIQTLLAVRISPSFPLLNPHIFLWLACVRQQSWQVVLFFSSLTLLSVTHKTWSCN